MTARAAASIDGGEVVPRGLSCRLATRSRRCFACSQKGAVVVSPCQTLALVVFASAQARAQRESFMSRIQLGPVLDTGHLGPDQSLRRKTGCRRMKPPASAARPIDSL
jgi:hypothetical protein